MAVDNRKWVGVRLSKMMMAQIEEIIENHPEWAWGTPNDFVRDSVRRHMEHVRKQDYYKRTQVETLPSKALIIARSVLDPSSTAEFEEKMGKLLLDIDPETDAEAFIDGVINLLSDIVGPTLAKSTMEKLYGDVKNR